MQVVINNTKINYYFDKVKSKDTIVLLHGWGQNIEMMMPIGNKYKELFNILIIDLPGFGKSDEPQYAWTVYEYTEMIHNLIEKLELKDIILIGHSFGGKISLVYSSKYKVKKLICLASPYCKEVSNNKLSLMTKIYNVVKKIPGTKKLQNIMKKHVGSVDYRNANPVMRDILVKTVNLDISEDVKKIKCPTLLIWGTMDTAVPISRAYELKNMIKDSGVIVYDGATHYAYLERLNQVICVLDSFLEIKR